MNTAERKAKVNDLITAFEALNLEQTDDTAKGVSDAVKELALTLGGTADMGMLNPGAAALYLLALHLRAETQDDCN